MFVTKKKYNETVAAYEKQLAEARIIIDTSTKAISMATVMMKKATATIVDLRTKVSKLETEVMLSRVANNTDKFN